MKVKNKPNVIIEEASASVVAPKTKKSKWVRPDLRYKINERGMKVYDVKASKLSAASFKTLVKQANERLRQIEKRGLQGESKEYQLVKYYAEEKTATKGAIYNIGKDGRIRFSSNLQKFVSENESFNSASDRRAYFINTLRNFLTSESSTVSGIKRIKNQAFATFKKNYGKQFKQNQIRANQARAELGVDLVPVREMTKDDYFNFWKMYRDNFSDTKKDKYGYNTIMTLLQNTSIMSLPADTIQNVMEFAESTRAEDERAGFVDAVIDMFPELKLDM